MGERGIGTSVHFIPLHMHPYYQRKGWRGGNFPVASTEYMRVVSLPVWPSVSRDDVQRVVDALSDIVRKEWPARV